MGHMKYTYLKKIAGLKTFKSQSQLTLFFFPSALRYEALEYLLSERSVVHQ